MKRAQQAKRAKRLVQGIVLQWVDKDPLSGKPFIERASVSHTSPVLRLHAPAVWRDFRHYIVHHQTLLWRIFMDFVFVDPDGSHDIHQRLVVHRGHLHAIANACLPTLEATCAERDNFLETRYRVECLGDRGKRESDYADYEPEQEAAQ